ncbi:transposase domain-containing protein [Pseudomonas sp. LY10J]|uniref:transposase domain-containing protein n=1 Tax=Pseudomonas TaxID=286 RepID=UPI001E655344|nr:transposase domain-containing protein [Pseudomonas sp. LY10J]
MFSDTPQGARASAQIYSLIETAKANGCEPYAWLRHVLERLMETQRVEDYEALMPWSCPADS